MPTLSLKSKMTITVSALVAGIMFTAGYITLIYFEKHIKETISQQQFTMATKIANDIDNKLLSLQKTIGNVSKAVTADMVDNPSKAQKFLNNKPEIRTIFDNSIF